MSARTDVTDNIDLHEALAGQPDRLAVVTAALEIAEVNLRRAMENWGSPDIALRNVSRAWGTCKEALK